MLKPQRSGERRIALRVDGLTKTFSGTRAVDDISFESRGVRVLATITGAKDP